MKQFKKLGAFLLALCLMIGAVACTDAPADVSFEPLPNGDAAGNAGPLPNGDASGDASLTEIIGNNDQASDPYEKLLDENGNVIDLQGINIIIADWFYVESDPSSDFQVAEEKWHKWLQDTYNFTVTNVAYSNWDNMPGDYINYVEAGGDEEYYIFTLPQGEGASQAISKGYMKDLAKLSALDFTDEKWNTGIYEYSMRGDSVYAMRGIEIEPRNGMYFNKRILEENGYTAEMIYDLQENGEWTWDKFEEICAACQKDFDNDGIPDQYAMSSFSSYFIPSAVFSNGGKAIDVDENGIFYSCLETDETLEGFTWAKNMRAQYEMPQPEGTQWDYFLDAFKNGQVAFTCHQSYQAGAFADEKTGCVDDFGFVCFPRGPRVTDPDGYYTYSEDNLFVIPSCYSDEKAEKIAWVYNQWTRDVPGYEGYPAWKTAYYNNFSDTEAVDLTLTRLIDNNYVSARLENGVYGLSGNDGIFGNMISWQLDYNEPADLVDACRDTVQSFLDDHNGLN